VDQINERLIAIEEWRTSELAKQILVMTEWREKQIKLTRKVLRYMALGLAIILVAIGVGFWQLDNLAETNRLNITHGQQVDLSLAEEQYRINEFRWNTCRERNELFRQQLRQDTAQLKKLIAAHLRDGSENAAQVWMNYLKVGEKANIVDCGEKPQLPENVLPPLPDAPRRTTGG
jgi:uncharacterized protein HemX